MIDGDPAREHHLADGQGDQRGVGGGNPPEQLEEPVTEQT
jgi:hypothetical protein